MTYASQQHLWATGGVTVETSLAPASLAAVQRSFFSRYRAKEKLCPNDGAHVPPLRRNPLMHQNVGKRRTGRFIIMKSLLLICALSALATSACGAKEASTFGLTVDYADGRPGTGVCQRAGNPSSGSYTVLDLPTPGRKNVMLDVAQDFEKERAYVVRATTFFFVDESATVPSPQEKLLERHYDEAFADSGKTDSFDFSFEGKTFPVTIKALSEQTPCPKTYF